MSKTSTYGVWKSMIARCVNKNVYAYPYYGGRGITVCDRWRHSFEDFLSDMGVKPAGYSIERIDTNGDYSPENCKWIPQSEQWRTKRTVRLYEFNGEKTSINRIAKVVGLSETTIRRRLATGARIDEAIRPHQTRSGLPQLLST